MDSIQPVSSSEFRMHEFGVWTRWLLDEYEPSSPANGYVVFFDAGNTLRHLDLSRSAFMDDRTGIEHAIIIEFNPSTVNRVT